MTTSVTASVAPARLPLSHPDLMPTAVADPVPSHPRPPEDRLSLCFHTGAVQATGMTLAIYDDSAKGLPLRSRRKSSAHTHRPRAHIYRRLTGTRTNRLINDLDSWTAHNAPLHLTAHHSVLQQATSVPQVNGKALCTREANLRMGYRT